MGWEHWRRPNRELVWRLCAGPMAGDKKASYDGGSSVGLRDTAELSQDRLWPGCAHRAIHCDWASTAELSYGYGAEGLFPSSIQWLGATLRTRLSGHRS